MRRILGILKEINNYFFLLRQIRKHKKSDSWKNQKYQLRTNWVGSIYTVVNLPPEVYNSEHLWERNYVIEEIKPLNSYLASINLSEIIRLKVKKINRANAEAYLVKYKPLFNSMSWWWIIKMSILFWILGYIQMKFDIIGKLINLTNWLINLFQTLIEPYTV